MHNMFSREVANIKWLLSKTVMPLIGDSQMETRWPKYLFLPSAHSQEVIHITGMMTTVYIEGCSTPNVKLVFTAPINVCLNVLLYIELI